MGVMAIMDRSGHTELAWKVDNEAEVREATETFDRLIASSWLGYKTTEATPESGEAIRRFDKTAEQIVMTPPLVGG